MHCFHSKCGPCDQVVGKLTWDFLIVIPCSSNVYSPDSDPGISNVKDPNELQDHRVTPGEYTKQGRQYLLAFCKNVPNLTQLRGRLLFLWTQALYIYGV